MAKVQSNPKTCRKTYIRAWRKHRGLTLESLAERIGVTAGNLSQLERGDVKYTQPMLEALADMLNCNPADLIMRDPSQTDAIWSIWDRAKQSQREQIVELAQVVLKTGTRG